MKNRLFCRVTIILLLVVMITPGSSVARTQEETAKEATKKMGAGWNLGNSLDSYSSTAFNAEEEAMKKGSYQIMSSYQSKGNNSPDIHTAVFTANTNQCTLKWKIAKLNSSDSSKCVSFGVQLINHVVNNTGNRKLEFQITKAQFVTKKGKKIILSDMLGVHKRKLTKGATSVIFGSLSRKKELKWSSQIIGGTLTIIIKIKKYPKPLNWVSNETYYETLWGNPITTKSMIEKVKEAGFGSVRIPVTYSNHMDNNGTIDKNWLNRIKKVVDYVLSQNMYCIINLHHDTGKVAWLKADTKTYKTNAKKLSKIWKQVALTFKSYDKRLLFEGFNEILNTDNQWSNAGDEAYKVTNHLNQIFVNAVREIKGNNARRNLIVSTYAAGNSEDILTAFKLPKDTTKNHLIVKVHSYAPILFSWNQDMVNWATVRSKWNGQTDEKEIGLLFERLNTHFIGNNIPVIIGEFGACNKNNLEDRVLYIKCYQNNGKKYGIPCFWWDQGGNFSKADQVTTTTLLNRTSKTWYFPELIKAFVQ